MSIDVSAIESASDWWQIIRRADGDIEAKARVRPACYVSVRQRRRETQQQCLDRLASMLVAESQAAST